MIGPTGAVRVMVATRPVDFRKGAEVLAALVEGDSNDQIAVRLYISRNTVRHHVHNILIKLGAVNRTEAVALALQHSLVEYAYEVG